MNQRWLLLSAVDSESSLDTLPLLMIQPSYWRRPGWILSALHCRGTLNLFPEASPAAGSFQRWFLLLPGNLVLT